MARGDERWRVDIYTHGRNRGVGAPEVRWAGDVTVGARGVVWWGPRDAVGGGGGWWDSFRLDCARVAGGG